MCGETERGLLRSSGSPASTRSLGRRSVAAINARRFFADDYSFQGRYLHRRVRAGQATQSCC